MINLFKNGRTPDFENACKIKDIEYYNVHTAEPDGYHFLLGSAIVYHNGILRCSFGNSLKTENDSYSIFAEKYSDDKGMTWKPLLPIAKAESGRARSHGVYFKKDDFLYAFCACFEFGKAGGYYPNLVMETYILKGDTFERCENICHGFWPLTEPVDIEGGYIMGGLESDSYQPAVALCSGDNPTKWKRKLIPNPEKVSLWGETAILKRKDRLTAIIRGDGEQAYISESFDNGQSWSNIELSDLTCADSKLYAGELSGGRRYLLFNMAERQYRKTLAIAISDNENRDLFDKVYIIRDGYMKKPIYFLNEWSYPYAIEHDKKLYVVYSQNKEDCELAVFPISSL